MEAKAIRKVSDAEITEAGFEYARKITKVIESSSIRQSSRKFLDSLQNAFSVKISYLQPSDSMLRGIEKKLIEAYTSGAEVKDLADNLQKIDNDSLLYTKPLMKERPDGSIEFTRALGVRISKRQIILSMK